MPAVSQDTLRADEAEPTTPSEGPGHMPGRWWDTGRGWKIPLLPAPASARPEVGHRSLRRQYTPPGWQPVALLRLLGTLLALGVSMSPAAALQRQRAGGRSRPRPHRNARPVWRKNCLGELLTRNQVAWLPFRHQFQCNARPFSPSLPHRRPFHRRSPRGSGLSWRPPPCWRVSGPCEADPTGSRHHQNWRALLDADGVGCGKSAAPHPGCLPIE